jgi:hypothetical protein
MDAGSRVNHRSATVHPPIDLHNVPNRRSHATVECIVTQNHTESPWRDPLSIGWQAHRRLLLLRLRWHASSRRRTVRRHTD